MRQDVRFGIRSRCTSRLNSPANSPPPGRPRTGGRPERAERQFRGPVHVGAIGGGLAPRRQRLLAGPARQARRDQRRQILHRAAPHQHPGALLLQQVPHRIEFCIGEAGITCRGPNDTAQPIRTPQPPEPSSSRARQILSRPGHRQADQRRADRALDQPGQQWHHAEKISRPSPVRADVDRSGQTGRRSPSWSRAVLHAVATHPRSNRVGFHNPVMAFELPLRGWPTVVMLPVGTR